jgi:hypothetical protein
VDEEESVANRALEATPVNKFLLRALIAITGLLATVHAQSGNVSQEWIVTRTTNPMDGIETITAVKRSVESPAASLVIRCKGKHADVYVDAKEVVSAESGVRVKFDQGKATRQGWERAASPDALFAPSAGEFLRSMKLAKLFYFEYTPYQRTERVVSFEVNSLPGSLYEACVTSTKDKAVAYAEALRMQQKKEAQERVESARQLAALRAKCAPFNNETLEQVERGVAALPSEECWDVLEWTELTTYEAVVKRRAVCNNPAFAKDPKFCGPPPPSQ